MDVFLVLKYAHVVSAILWLGGGFALLLACGMMAGRARAADQLSVVRVVALLGPRLFMPASIATLATGVALTVTAGWGWQPFTILGLAGIAFTALFGALVLGPAAERAVRRADAEGPVAALADARRLIRLARFDYAVQFAIVFLMVVKPGWSEMATFAAIGGVLALAALASFRPAPQPA